MCVPTLVGGAKISQVDGEATATFLANEVEMTMCQGGEGWGRGGGRAGGGGGGGGARG